MKIEVTGFKELYIQEIIDQSYNEMIESTALSPGKQLKYCNGFLLDIAGFDPSDEMKTDEANGIYKFQIVYFAETEKQYSPIIKHADSNTSIPVYNVSKSTFYTQLLVFCKKYIEEMNR